MSDEGERAAPVVQVGDRRLGALSQLREIVGARDLFLNLTLRELRGKYKRSVLGWGWSLLNPIATMAILTAVFSVLLKAKPDPGDPSGLDVFALYLLCALLPWNYVASCISGGMGTLVGNAGLIKKVYFPRQLLVASNVASLLFSFAIEMSLLAVVLLGFGNFILPWLPLVILLMAIQTFFVLGIALSLSVLNVYFRDTQYLVGIMLQLWFYATPIIYPVKLVSEHLHGVWLQLYEANPMLKFIEAYRNVLYDLRFPSAGTMAYLVIVSLVSVWVGLAVFGRYEGRLAEEL